MKLMLVDDHPLFLEGLQYVLETYSIEVAGIVQDGREAYDMARVLQPDVILMDIKMPGCDGIDALKLIKAQMPQIKVVMLTTSDEEEDIFNALRSGASGYLLKSTNARELVDMLSDLEKGELPLSPGLAAQVLKEFEHNDLAVALDDIKEAEAVRQLNEHQLEILDLVAKGLTYKQTADMLGLSERTIKYHMGKIIDILHLKNRAQVIAYAASMKLVDVK
ncbi:MAG: response regulator transcription factor [Deltaproteobacteria bacterium]